MDLERNVVGAILEANGDGRKLPWALMVCGVLEAAAALWMLVHKPPVGIFLDHGKVVFYSYYLILVVVLLFGLVEAWIGYAASGDLEGWRAAGKKVLWLTIIPLVVLIGLGLGGSIKFA
jgi:hypothetical protein